MDKINKALLKLTSKQRAALIADFAKLLAGDIKGLNIRKMKGTSNLYRLRVGRTRLVYTQNPKEQPIIIFVGKRDDQTYRQF